MGRFKNSKKPVLIHLCKLYAVNFTYFILCFKENTKNTCIRVIILTTQTMHYYKGNPLKITHRFVSSLIPRKSGSHFMIPENHRENGGKTKTLGWDGNYPRCLTPKEPFKWGYTTIYRDIPNKCHLFFRCILGVDFFKGPPSQGYHPTQVAQTKDIPTWMSHEVSKWLVNGL